MWHLPFAQHLWWSWFHFGIPAAVCCKVVAYHLWRKNDIFICNISIINIYLLYSVIGISVVIKHTFFPVDTRDWPTCDRASYKHWFSSNYFHWLHFLDKWCALDLQHGRVTYSPNLRRCPAFILSTILIFRKLMKL